MKKTIVLMLMVAAILLSGNACKKSEDFSQATVDEGQAMPVLFGSNLQSSVSTRTRGALEQWTGNEDLYIYGLRRLNGKYVIPTGTDLYAENDPNAYLIRNETAKSPTGGVTHGEIKVYRDPAREEYFYYRETPHYYNFYGYYVDNAHILSSWTTMTAPQPTETSRIISLKVDIGDNSAISKKGGTQDIMLAHTNRVADAAGTGVDTSRVYGAYAARRNIKPNLIFKHQLARFDFNLKAGTHETAANVTVQSLKVFSKTRGTLVIASNDTITSPRGIFPDTSQEPVALTVQGASGALTEAGRDFGSIMVMPGESVYTVELKIKQEGYSFNDGIITQPAEINFADIKPSASGFPVDTQAVSGHKYNVSLKVYGLEPVQIEVTMAQWEDNHGYFEIDPDNN